MTTDHQGVDARGTQEPKSVTQREYARLRGISEVQVSKYKSSGRLVLDTDGGVLVAESDRQLAEILDPLRGGDRSKRAGSDRISYLEAKTDEARARAVKATLESELMAAKLVRVDEVEAEVFARARGAQELLMVLPDRLAPLFAAETNAATIHTMMTDELRRVCQAIAEATP